MRKDTYIYSERQRQSSKQLGHDEIINIERDREIRVKRTIVQRKIVLRE